MSQDKQHLFMTPAGSEASMFLQWKNTDVCLDFYCRCGEFSHFDGYGAYAVRCPNEYGGNVVDLSGDDE